MESNILNGSYFGAETVANNMEVFISWKSAGKYYDDYSVEKSDLNNNGVGGFAGSITAALFLKRFVEKAKAYVHFDVYGWVPTPKPGRPKGGEAQGMRALFALITECFGN